MPSAAHRPFERERTADHECHQIVAPEVAYIGAFVDQFAIAPDAVPRQIGAQVDVGTRASASSDRRLRRPRSADMGADCAGNTAEIRAHRPTEGSRDCPAPDRPPGRWYDWPARRFGCAGAVRNRAARHRHRKSKRCACMTALPWNGRSPAIPLADRQHHALPSTRTQTEVFSLMSFNYFDESASTPRCCSTLSTSAS